MNLPLYRVHTVVLNAPGCLTAFVFCLERNGLSEAAALSLCRQNLYNVNLRQEKANAVKQNKSKRGPTLIKQASIIGNGTVQLLVGILIGAVLTNLNQKTYGLHTSPGLMPDMGPRSVCMVQEDRPSSWPLQQLRQKAYSRLHRKEQAHQEILEPILLNYYQANKQSQVSPPNGLKKTRDKRCFIRVGGSASGNVECPNLLANYPSFRISSNFRIYTSHPFPTPSFAYNLNTFVEGTTKGEYQDICRQFWGRVELNSENGVKKTSGIVSLKTGSGRRKSMRFRGGF